MNQATPGPESATSGTPRTRPDWERLLQTRRRHGAVFGRLVRPPVLRRCSLSSRCFIAAKLEAVDTEGVELDVTLVAFGKRHERELCKLASAPVGALIFAEGEIEATDWSPSSVRMFIEDVWPVDKPPLLVSAGAIIAEEDAARRFAALEKAKSKRSIFDEHVGDPFGQVADLQWIRGELARNGVDEHSAVDSYVWGVFPDIDFGAVESDPVKAKRAFRESERRRDALEHLVEIALDGNMIAAMQIFGGFGGLRSDDKEAVLKGMLRLPLEIKEMLEHQVRAQEQCERDND